MNRKLTDALEKSLQRLQQGEPLDSVLAGYPHLAARLRPLLETALRARSLDQAGLPASALARQRTRGLSLAADLRRSKRPRQLKVWRPVMTALSVIAILVLSSNGLLIASAHSIPGDTLYPLKRTVESTQLQLASGSARKQALEHTFEERRVDETRSLITDQRIEEVEFNGQVTQMSSDEWVVSGISVYLTARTRVDPGIRVGDEIDVDGVTNVTGGLNATHLSLLTSPDDDSLAPLPAPTLSTQPAEDATVQNDSDGSSISPDSPDEGTSQPAKRDDGPSEKSSEGHDSGEKSGSRQSDSGESGQD